MQCPKCGYRLNPKGSKCCGICGNYFIPENQLRAAKRLQIALSLLFSIFLMGLVGSGVALVETFKTEKPDTGRVALCTMVSKPEVKEPMAKGQRFVTVERAGSTWKVYYSIWDPVTGKSKQELIVRTSKKQAENDIKTWMKSGYIQVR